jgi:uncharacterized Tic20 family protein
MKPSSEERILAVIAHLSALAMGAGMVVPTVLWSSQREKSKYAAFQSLQAYGYQSLGYTVWMLAYLLFFVLIFIALVVIAGVVPNAAQNEQITRIFSILLMVFTLGMFGLYFLFPILAVVTCALGKDYHYPILGGRLTRFLEVDETMNEVNAERWAVAMGHFAVIIPLWGLLGPLYLWLAGGKESVYLKIQSAQTTIYQILVNILYFLAACIGIVLFLLSVLLLSAADVIGMPGIAALMVLLCVFGLFALIVPLFHILGQWAGLRVLQGHDFRYPLIGCLVENWLKRSPKS